MINIKIYNNGLIVNNHANFARHGNDIVCAGVSAVVMGSLSWFDFNDIVDYVVDEKEPLIKIVLVKNDRTMIALSLISNQLLEIRKSYPKFILFEKVNNNL